MQSVFVKGSFLGLLGGALLLAGCGGGGGGGGGSSFSFTDILDYGGDSPTELFNVAPSSTPSGVPTAAVTISPTNQNEVAGAAVSGVDGAIVGEAVSVLGALYARDVQSFSAFGFAEDTLFKYLGEVGAAQTAATSAKTVLSATGPCDSGSATFSVDVANPNGGSVEAGDSLTISFDNCYDSSDGSTTDGAMMIVLNSGSLDFNASSFSSSASISMSFNNLSSTSGSLANVIHGGFTISTNGTTSTLSGASLYFMSAGESALLTNFNVSGTTSGSGTDTLTVSLTLASTTINGLINVVTDPADPLVQDAFENHPHAGTLIITGGTTTLTMQALSSTQVSLSLDSDSNGTPDTGYPVTVNWTDIDAAGGGINVEIGGGGSGSGTVIGTDAHGDSIATATTVALPSTTPGTINSASDLDYFRVDVVAAGLLTVYTTGSLDTYGYLYDAGGFQLAADDDGGSVWNFSISYSVTPGTYYIRVNELFQDVGSYSLVAQFTP